jgi:hypothetical protein
VRGSFPAGPMSSQMQFTNGSVRGSQREGEWEPGTWSTTPALCSAAGVLGDNSLAFCVS